MIDFHKELAGALEQILPTYYEMALYRGLETPCISYMELNNYASADGDTMGYSVITYQVKVWGNEIAVLQRYALEIDKALRPLGFKRIASGEMYDNQSTMIQKILTFEATAQENFN